MTETAPREPVFQAPAVVTACIAVFVAVHAVRQFVAADIDQQIILNLAFFPARFGAAGSQLPGPDWLAYTSMVTHALLHGDWSHLLLNSAWFLAFGTMIARRTGTWRFLVFLMVCAAAGAIAFLLANPGQIIPIVGASGAISGLMGAAFRVLFSALDQGGISLLQHVPRLIPRMPLQIALTDRRVVVATLAWVGINLLFAWGLSGVLTQGEIAWEAHLGGFAAGFLAFALFDCGRGWSPPDRDVSHPVPH
ncbi:MAG: rhomboid family intramembrane serine protease [Hyphomicrobiaceae bacterium]|nr:rhomboid family intramembrane serine protease [Hyphomicrobiaceae bacterium]